MHRHRYPVGVPGRRSAPFYNVACGLIHDGVVRSRCEMDSVVVARLRIPNDCNFRSCGWPNWSTTITGIGPLAPTVRPWLHVVSLLGLSPLGPGVLPIPNVPTELPPASPELGTIPEPWSTVVPPIFPPAQLDELTQSLKDRIMKQRRSCRVTVMSSCLLKFREVGVT
jgi:hypothetical protein